MAKYIEKQVAIDVFENLADEDWNKNTGTTWANAFIKVASMIDGIPPADVRPVWRGRWVPMDLTYGRSYFFCSACEEKVDMQTAMGIPLFRYCPNCGADMRGDDAE